MSGSIEFRYSLVNVVDPSLAYEGVGGFPCLRDLLEPRGDSVTGVLMPGYPGRVMLLEYGFIYPCRVYRRRQVVREIIYSNVVSETIAFPLPGKILSLPIPEMKGLLYHLVYEVMKRTKTFDRISARTLRRRLLRLHANYIMHLPTRKSIRQLIEELRKLYTRKDVGYVELYYISSRAIARYTLRETIETVEGYCDKIILMKYKIICIS